MSLRSSPRQAPVGPVDSPLAPVSSAPRAVLLAALLAAVSLFGCADEPHFDHAQYMIVTSSPVLRDYAGGSYLAQPANWLFDVLGYVPTFCAQTSTTTVLNGGRTVALDWQGCQYGGRTVVGELDATSEGAYEGLVEVTALLDGSLTTFETWLRLVPAEVIEE